MPAVSPQYPLRLDPDIFQRLEQIFTSARQGGPTAITITAIGKDFQDPLSATIRQQPLLRELFSDMSAWSLRSSSPWQSSNADWTAYTWAELSIFSKHIRWVQEQNTQGNEQVTPGTKYRQSSIGQARSLQCPRR